MKKLIFRLAQVLCCLSFILMLLQYSLVLKYAKEGLFVWASCVLPLLLPFIILSKFWIRYEIPQLFFKQVHRLVPAGTTIAISLPVFLLGLCSGFLRKPYVCGRVRPLPDKSAGKIMDILSSLPLPACFVMLSATPDSRLTYFCYISYTKKAKTGQLILFRQKRFCKVCHKTFK